MIDDFYKSPYYVPSEPETLRFFGKIQVPDGPPRDAWISISYKRFEPSEIECSLYFPEAWHESRFIPDLDSGNLKIYTQAPHKGIINLNMIGGGVYSNTEAKFSVGGYELLQEPAQLSRDSRVRIVVDLTNSRLIRPGGFKVSALGSSVEIMGDGIDAVEWTTAEESYKVSTRADLERVKAGQDVGSLIRQRPFLVKDLRVSDDLDASRLLNELELELTEILRLLSFISREWIDWFEILVLAGERLRFTAKRRKQIWELRPADRREQPLLNKKDLINGGFPRLLSEFRSSPYFDDLSRAMAYNLSSRQSEGIESNYILAFAALETLVNSLDNLEPLLPEKKIKWRKLRSAVAACVEHHRREGITDCQARIIKDKIEELKRPSIRERIRHHASKLNVKIDDIWLDMDTSRKSTREGSCRGDQAAQFACPPHVYGELRRS